jgi:hypothetical protein
MSSRHAAARHLTAARGRLLLAGLVGGLVLALVACQSPSSPPPAEGRAAPSTVSASATFFG